MIAPVAVAAPAPIAFAPPLGRTLTYVAIEHQPSESGATTVTLTQSLRFDRAADGALTATQTLLDAKVEAPARTRAAIEALEVPLIGQPVTARIAPDGTPGGVIDAERSWRSVAESYASLERKATEAGMASPTELALLRALVAAQTARTPADREARLRESVVALLPPPLPALAPGEERAFMSENAAHGTTRLLSRTADRAVYRVTIVEGRATGAAEAVSLRARIVATTTAADRARIEALAAALDAATLSETQEIEIDARTGLLLSLHSLRSAVDDEAPPRLLAERTVTLQP